MLAFWRKRDTEGKRGKVNGGEDDGSGRQKDPVSSLLRRRKRVSPSAVVPLGQQWGKDDGAGGRIIGGKEWKKMRQARSCEVPLWT